MHKLQRCLRKNLLNAVVSEDADWFTLDIGDFYITKGNQLEQPEYMWIALDVLPDDIVARYNLKAIAHKGKALVRIDSAIYGLPQAGRIAQQRLFKRLAAHGYHQCPNTSCLFKHETRPIMFALVVDGFGIKVKGKEHADHLVAALQEIYRLTIDWTGEKFLGMTIKHDREEQTLSISMPNHVQKALNRFEANDIKTANSPIHYMLAAVNKVASEQARPTVAVEKAANRILQYAKKFPNATIVYKASDMQLRCHSDASYLSETRSRSRAGGFFFLGDSIGDEYSNNGSVDCISSIIPRIVASASAAEAEYAALFMVGQLAADFRPTLEDIGYPQ